MENTKTTRLLSKGSWILTYFWHSRWHYFGYISGKVAKPHFLESPQKSLKTRYEITAFWKYERFVFFWWLLFQMKKLLTFGIFNESNIWAKVYYIFKKKRGLSKLLLDFIEYCLDQLNSTQTKIAVNSAIQYFERCSQRKCLLKVKRFLVHPPQNGSPVKFLRN